MSVLAKDSLGGKVSGEASSEASRMHQLLSSVFKSLSSDLSFSDSVVSELLSHFSSSSSPLSPLQIQEIAASCENVDEVALALALLAFHYQRCGVEGSRTSCAYNVVALLLSQVRK